MTQLNVQIDAEAVEKAFVMAVLKAGIGIKIEEAVEKALTIRHGYHNKTILEEAIDAEVTRITQKTLRTDYEEVITKRVKESFDKDKITQMVDKVVEGTVEKILN